MNLPKLAVSRPTTTAMILLSVLVIGAIALTKLPRDYLPEVDVPFVMVQIPYPNSHPRQVEKEITKPVEEALATLSGVKKLRSYSRADEAEIHLEFDWGHDLDVVRIQVNEKMEQLEPELPADIGEILILSFSTSDIPVVQGRISARGVDLSANYDLIESRIVNRIRRVPGVARVDVGGVEPKEIYIDLILDRLKEHNVDVSQLVRKLQGTSSNLVLGQVDQAGRRFSARALGGFQTLEEIKRLPIDERGLRLEDIAEVTYEEPPIGHGRHLDGEYAIALEVYKESTANTVDVVNAVFDVIHHDVDRDPLLKGVELFIWEDQAKEITNAINGLGKAGLIGALLSVLSLYFFLRRLDSTLIVALCIPFSILAACGVLYFMGESLNMLSMMGLMLGVGMLVDNAVVVLESIDRVHREERDPRRAALVGSSQVAMAVAASTLTTVIVFLPLVVGGKSDLTTWLGKVGVAISIALVCSLFSSLTLIPLMSAHFLKRKRNVASPFLSRLEDHYVRALSFTLRRKGWTFLILVAGLAIGLLPFFTGMVESAMFSATVNRRVFFQYEFADFTYKSDARAVVRRVEAALEPHREEFQIDSVYSYFAENTAQTTLTLTREDLDDDEIRELQEQVREALPQLAGVKFIFDDDAETGGSTTSFQVKFFGQDTDLLETFAEEAARRLEAMPDIQDVRTSLRGEQREIRVLVDRERAHRLGLTAGDVADVFNFTLGGLRLPRFNAGDREVETWLALRREDRENLADLKQLTLRPTGGGPPVLLGDIATFQVVPRANQIVREDRKSRVSVRATYNGKTWPEVQKAIAEQMDSFALPPGYSWSWNDRILEQQSQNQQMMINFLLALLLVYIVMASLFESLAQPFAILVSIVFALPGAAWTLGLTGTPLNLMGQIGFLILMGIVVNNGIVLLDYINQLRAAGLSVHDAILEAGRARMRPILMTASTTIIGLLPLAIRGTSAGGLFYYPMARAVMGGLLSSSVLTLLALPYITLGVERVAAWLREIWTLSTPRRAADIPADAPARATLPT